MIFQFLMYDVLMLSKLAIFTGGQENLRAAVIVEVGKILVGPTTKTLHSGPVKAVAPGPGHAKEVVVDIT